MIKNIKLLIGKKYFCRSLRILIIITVLLSILLYLPSVYAVCPPQCTSAEFMNLIYTDPSAAYKMDPEKAVSLSVGSVLKDYSIASDYFKKNPKQILNPVYHSYAQSYLVKSTSVNPELYKTYLSTSAFSESQDKELAKRYFQAVGFASSDDRALFVRYTKTYSSLSGTDKALAKKFLTESNGQYINTDKDTKGLFGKYLESEGITVTGIKGNVISFTSSGLLTGSNGNLNVYELGKNGAKNKYALKVEENGAVSLILKKKDEEQTKQLQAGVAKAGQGWNKLVGDLGLSSLSLSEKTIQGAADAAAVYTDTGGKVPFKGNLQVNGETGKLDLADGSIREVGVKGAKDVEVTPEGFSGTFKEVAGVVFKEPSKIKVRDWYGYHSGFDEKDEYTRINPVIEGDGAVIEAIKPYTFGSYELDVLKEGKDGEENAEVEHRTYTSDVFHGDNGVLLTGTFDIENYDKVDSSRQLYVPPTTLGGASLTLNGVTIQPEKGGHQTYVYMPQSNIPDNYKGERFVQFNKKGILVSGSETEVSFNPSALVKNELAATGTTHGVFNFPDRGYFKVGDKPPKNSKEAEAIRQIQSSVGVAQTGVYDQATYNAVKSWQSTKTLNSKKLKSDGLFGKDSLQAYLTDSQGDIKITTKQDFHHSSVTAEKGTVKISAFGFVDADVGRKRYSFNLVGSKPQDPKLAAAGSVTKQEKDFTTVKESEVPGSEEVVPVIPAVPGEEGEDLLQMAGLAPNTPDVTIDYQVSPGSTYSVDHVKYLAAQQTLSAFYNFDGREIYQSTGNLVDALVSPALISVEKVSGTVPLANVPYSAEKRVVAGVNPEFKDLASDGKIVMLIITGRRDEPNGLELNHDANVMIPATQMESYETPEGEVIEYEIGGESNTPSPVKIYRQFYETPDGKPLEVEVRVAFTPEDAEKEYVKEDVDVVHMSAHSQSWKTQRISLGENRGAFSPLDLEKQVREDPDLKVDKTQRLVSIRSCVAVDRVYPGVKELEETLRPGAKTDYLVAQHKPILDIATDVLGGLLSGQSLEQIKTIADAEEGKQMFLVNPVPKVDVVKK